MMRFSYACLCLFFILIMAGCKKPYNPGAIKSAGSYLVVEGFISTNDTIVVKLSRTVRVDSHRSADTVLGAAVAVEDDQNGSFSLTEAANGRYKLGGLALNESRKYRLRIKTADKKEYVSDFVQPVSTPPIDSVGYTINGDKIDFYVNTHNAPTASRYYRWDYGETWMIRTKFVSLFKAYVSGTDRRIGYRSLRDEINICWSSDSSSSITLGSSDKLTQNVIASQPITSVPRKSEKFTERYSILVNQYALSKDAYTYYQKLKTNTEQLGSIFDAQPSQLTGNVHCVTNPGEPVLGYIAAGSVTHKRIFVNGSDLPPALLDLPYYGCTADTLLYTNSYFARFYYLDEIPVNAIVDPKNTKDTLGYTASSGICVDCTLRGTNKQPAFWK